MKDNPLRVILALFLAGAALQAVRIACNAREPVELDFGEGAVLSQAAVVFDLKAAFHPLDQYPHVPFNYTPVYHLAVRAVMILLRDPLLSGRVVSMLAALWLAVLFGWTVRRATRGYAPDAVRWLGAVFAGACVLQLPTMQWAPLVRVDLLGMAIQFTGLSLVCAGRFRLRHQVAACFLLLLGVYTKQNLLAIPAAALLLVGLIRPARALQLACGLAAAGSGILAILAWATDGAVIRYWILYNVHSFSLNRALSWEDKTSRNMAALIATGFAGAWLVLPRSGVATWRKWQTAVSARLAGSALRRTGLGFALAALLGFATSLQSGKEGSNINYCIEWQLALCPLAGLFLVLFQRTRRQPGGALRLLRPLVLVLLGTAGLQFGLRAILDANDAAGFTGTAQAALVQSRRDQAELVRLIASFPGPVVCENMVALLQAGKSIPFEPLLVKMLTQAGKFDESALLKKVSDGFFDAMILNSGEYHRRYTPRMLAAIRQNYRRHDFSDSNYVVYVRQR